MRRTRVIRETKSGKEPEDSVFIRIGARYSLNAMRSGRSNYRKCQHCTRKGS